MTRLPAAWARKRPRVLFSLIAFSLVVSATGCASTPHAIAAEDLAEVRSALDAGYWPGFRPLSRPVAVVSERQWHFLSGPCTGMRRSECEAAFPGIRLVAPATDYILEAPDAGRTYSSYASAPPDVLLRRIAHEQFHVFLRLQAKSDNGTEQQQSWKTPTAEEIAGVLNELHFLGNADAHKERTLSCARQATKARYADSQASSNAVLARASRVEGSAKFVEVMYAARGDVTAAERLLEEYREHLLDDLYAFDWPNRLSLMAYYLGARAHLLALERKDVLSPHPQSLHELVEVWPEEVCGEAFPYSPASPVVVRLASGMRQVRDRAIERFFKAGEVFFLAGGKGDYEYVASGRVYLPGGTLIWGDVVVHQDGMIDVSTDEAVILACAEGRWRGVLVNDRSAAPAAEAVTLEQARQLVLRPDGCAAD